MMITWSGSIHPAIQDARKSRPGTPGSRPSLLKLRAKHQQPPFGGRGRHMGGERREAAGCRRPSQVAEAAAALSRPIASACHTSANVDCYGSSLTTSRHANEHANCELPATFDSRAGAPDRPLDGHISPAVCSTRVALREAWARCQLCGGGVDAGRDTDSSAGRAGGPLSFRSWKDEVQGTHARRAWKTKSEPRPRLGLLRTREPDGGLWTVDSGLWTWSGRWSAGDPGQPRPGWYAIAMCCGGRCAVSVSVRGGRVRASGANLKARGSELEAMGYWSLETAVECQWSMYERVSQSRANGQKLVPRVHSGGGRRQRQARRAGPRRT
ncbi:hypothetical protein K466DRAFT_125543 [Polyporus arcularius HHB13444]|uniref:Uncharacterized protein n=1 Tax=Polyporus arcularius HHB13444 TaxID=1314778 RepID=A0A5C3PBN1_9APHY|nr:hypothetical protein K466DRAFT_125543 [Polyporus arcularius HHB13444]